MSGDREYLKTLEELVLAAGSVSELSDREFETALVPVCDALEIRSYETCVSSGGDAGRRKSRRRMFPPADLVRNTEHCREISETFSYDDLQIESIVLVPEELDETDESARLRMRAVLEIVSLRVHRQYLRAHRSYLHRVDQQMGVFNQDYALEWVESLLREGLASEYAGCSFNLRGMAVVNNHFGTENGTRIMRIYVQTLQELLGGDGVVARIASDRFLAFFPKSDLQQVIAYLEGHELAGLEGVGGTVNMSAWAGFDLLHSGETAMEVVDRMNAALRTARYDSNTTYVFYDEEIQQRVNLNKHIESLFRNALREEEFQVYYQPKVDLKRYRLAGAEALCRWKHDGKMILPYQFIPVLENSGDICALDFYMLEHVCRDLRKWIDEGRNIVRVSVNLSRCHMGDPHLFEEILAIIDRYSIPHWYIEIELTETTSDMSFEEMQKLVTELRNVGVSCSVDDFGVGYSSMNVLREMPWNLIKIDRSFMPSGSGDAEDEKKKTMLKSIIALTLSLGLSCIAEGVETVDQVVLLKSYGCFMAQGFYFDRPMDVREFEGRLQE